MTDSQTTGSQTTDASPLERMLSRSASRRQVEQEIVREYIEEGSVDLASKPFVGAQPKLLKQPEILDVEEVDKRNKVACTILAHSIGAANKVVVILGNDMQGNMIWKDLLHAAEEGLDEALTFVALAESWMHTFPRVHAVPTIWDTHVEHSLLVCIGNPSKYVHVCTRSILTPQMDVAYQENRLVVICRGGCMLPIGTQVENIYGTDYLYLTSYIAKLLKNRGIVAWGHGDHSKADILRLSYPAAMDIPVATEGVESLAFSVTEEEEASFDLLADYVRHLNELKLKHAQTPVVNYYDTGMLVSVCMGTIANRGVSLLLDRDGLCMLRDASIGHTMSKLNQLLSIQPYRAQRGVYNFFIGDGASRLNGGAELVLHLMQDYEEAPFVTVFLFNNEMWAIEDNLISHKIKQHALCNRTFYDLLQAHPRVTLCGTSLELRAVLDTISKETSTYLAGSSKPEVRLVVLRGVDVDIPPMLGNLEPILQSSDMAFLRDTLGFFAQGCANKIPIYACSAFEYIQFLDIFLLQKPEGQCYQYVCGRTDIQASQMSGYRQPDGKCVVMINDIFGINSIGESLRALFTNFGDDQVLLMIWHPTLTRVIDNFHLHRPPMVWPSLGSHLCEYYARSTRDILTFDFHGEPTTKVKEALRRGTPLVIVNMLPEHERNYVGLDIRIKVQKNMGKKESIVTKDEAEPATPASAGA